MNLEIVCCLDGYEPQAAPYVIAAIQGCDEETLTCALGVFIVCAMGDAGEALN